MGRGRANVFSRNEFGMIWQKMLLLHSKRNESHSTGRLNYRSWENQEGQNESVVDMAIDEVAPSLRWAVQI